MRYPHVEQIWKLASWTSTDDYCTCKGLVPPKVLLKMDDEDDFET